MQTIIEAIKATPNSGKLDVRGTMGFASNILKLDTLTFADQAALIIENSTAEFIAIAVNQVILDIRNPQFKAYISRPVGAIEQQIIEGLRGREGRAGAKGADGAGEVNRDGLPGDDGGVGTSGLAGAVPHLPPVFFFVQKLKFGNDADPGRQFLVLNFSGIRGGAGGNGGAGGSGGDGYPGKKGANDIFGRCTSEAGRGGNGGGGGRGGRGGDSANGGAGGNIFLFAPSADLFNFSTANIEGGEPGPVGLGGSSGRGGRGAKGGDITPCTQKVIITGLTPVWRSGRVGRPMVATG